MNGLFSMDGKLFSFLSRVADLVILNILYIVCCLPVITIGTSTTALYYMTLKMVKNEECYIIKGFFKSFKMNFKQGTIIWLIAAITGFIMYLDFRIVKQTEFSFNNIMSILLMAVLLLWSFTVAYVFPLLAKFDNTVKNSIRNAFLMSIRHLPSTIVLLIIPVIVVGLMYFFPRLFPFFLLFGFSLPAFVGSFLLVRVFENYIPKDDEEVKSEIN